jgi:hypothetical protein
MFHINYNPRITVVVVVLKKKKTEQQELAGINLPVLVVQ